MPAVTAKEFLKALWGTQPGVAELSWIVKRPATEHHAKSSIIKSDGFTYPDSLDSLLGAAKNHNVKGADVYMGVCLRRSRWEIGHRGTEELALSSNVVWLDIDFEGEGHKGKTIEKKKAHEMISQFKLKPSIIVKTGGGVHVYWLLKETALGAELHTVKKVNKALTKYFGTDPVGDLARVLRIPGFPPYLNLKYSPPRPVEVLFWKPEHSYAFKDFDFLPKEPEVDVPRLSLAPASGYPPAGTPAPSGASGSGHEPRPTPTFDLDEEACRIAGKLFAEIWFEGYRHDMSLCVAGWLAFSGVKYECAAAIVQIASDLAKGDTASKLKNVKDTYEKFVKGAEVKGRPTLETMIDEAFPIGSRSQAKKTLDAIHKLMPRPRGSRKMAAEVDFKILDLVKYTSQPAVWTVTLEKDGKKLVTKTEHSRFMKYEVFVEDVCDQNTIMPAAGLKNPEWRHMINQAIGNGLYEEKTAPPESRPAGAIEKGLEDFLGEAKENPDIGLLKKFPGYDEEDTFFRLETFRDFLEEQGRKVNQSQLTEKLKAMGWESKVRRFGKKTPHVWLKSAVNGSGGNGHGHGGNGNGHGPAGPSAPSGQAPSMLPPGSGDVTPVTPSATPAPSEPPTDLFQDHPEGEA